MGQRLRGILRSFLYLRFEASLQNKMEQHHHHVSDSEVLLKSGAPRSLQTLTETAEESTVLWVGPPGPLIQVGNTSSISHAQTAIFELHATQDSHKCHLRHL